MPEQKNQNSEQKSKKALKNYAKHSAIAFQMMAIVLIGIFGGMKLDQLITKMEFPLFTMVLSISGVVFATYYSIKDFLKPPKKE